MPRGLTWAVAAALLSASSLPAQEHQHRPMEGTQHQDHMMGDMPGHAFHPMRLLEKKSELKLSPEQVTKLERLAADAKAKHDEAKARHDAHHAQLMTALVAARPSPEDARMHFQQAHEAMGAAHWAQLEAGLAALAVLTEEQRAAVRGMMRGQHQQHHQETRSESCCPRSR